MAGEKFIQNVSGVLTEIVSVQSAAADRIPSLDGSGLLPLDMMPVGLGADTETITTSENLAAGDLVNLWDSTGIKARKADATTAGKEAVGFVLSAYASFPESALIYFEGKITGLTGLTVGAKYYLDTTAGLITTTPPSSTNNVSQYVGTAVATTKLSFEPAQAITIA